MFNMFITEFQSSSMQLNGKMRRGGGKEIDKDVNEPMITINEEDIKATIEKYIVYLSKDNTPGPSEVEGYGFPLELNNILMPGDCARNIFITWVYVKKRQSDGYEFSVMQHQEIDEDYNVVQIKVTIFVQKYH